MNKDKNKSSNNKALFGNSFEQGKNKNSHSNKKKQIQNHNKKSTHNNESEYNYFQLAIVERVDPGFIGLSLTVLYTDSLHTRTKVMYFKLRNKRPG